MNTFEELQLSAPILKALGRCGYKKPTPVQSEAVPAAMQGRDLIVSAQTGTGKTAAFMLPALQRLFESPGGRKRSVRVLVITPTRELAGQITQVTRNLSQNLKIQSTAVFGGMPLGDQVRALSRVPEIVVATPGRLIDHIWRGRIDLSGIEMLVLDEADRMLDMGFIEDVEFISDSMPEGCQRLLFAATMNEPTTKLAHKFLNDPQRIAIAPGKATHDAIDQSLHMVDGLQHKNKMLRHICRDTSLTKAIIFSATKRDAANLARELTAEGHSAAALHADMTQSARNRTIMDLRRGKIRLLVATDVAARGIDITGISHVINFDLPHTAEDYVNRIGRTGRAGESGTAISFVSRADFAYLERIERYLGQNLSVRVIPGLEPVHPIQAQAAGPKTWSKGRGFAGRAKGSAPGKRPFRRDGAESASAPASMGKHREKERNGSAARPRQNAGHRGAAQREN
ncbi:MAG: DEAD/DEAH box helicase [Syntrophobacteraceae bacterium]|nr:DEAD/DEAH box helicase [Desulfobacteraceae bacterium]